jgi:GH15 family glucan-1,4-alpha-glucosidase
MPVRVWKSALGLLLMGAACKGQVSRSPWKGYAILGNGNLTAVYSDDSRITASTQAEGIQHLYFKDYTADYVASTRFRLLGEDGSALTPEGAAVVGMRNFFTTQTVARFANALTQTVRCFVDADGAVVSSSGGRGRYQFTAALRDTIKTDQTITLRSLRVVRNIALAEWSNGTVVAIASKSVQDKIAATDASVVITGSGSQAQVLIVPADSEQDAIAKIGRMRNTGDLEAAASKYWNTWMDSGKVPSLPAKYLEAYKRNLYCVKSANLNGQIPADITGQFVTNNMPQIYPRDAMMCARVLLLSGHADEAKQVIDFWARPQVPMKSPGEWYARYDAHAKPVDAGSGARFDEPEWDANGYYIYLLDAYHRAKGASPADSRLVYLLADFLVAHIGPNGLLHEGGIVEWTGDLPATNMIDAAALSTASRMAHQFGDQERSALYAEASGRLSMALQQMFDPARQTYGDVRFTGVKGPNGESLPGQGQKLYLWDTTADVGVIWGYPNHRELELSNVFYKNNTVKLAGGMQYFDSPDPGLAGYGHGVFFFTTAAAAEYEMLRGQKSAAQDYIDWMMRNGNSYGLMPEHISPDGAEVSPASPLSWCSAEFAAALLLWSGS